MVLGKIKKLIKQRELQKEQKKEEEEHLENFREDGETKEAEKIKKEADRLAQLKQYKTAIEEYKNALEAFPYKETDNDLFVNSKNFLFKTYFNIAGCYSYLDKFDEAIKNYDKCLNIDIDDTAKKVKTLMGKGNSHYRMKMYIDGIYSKGSYVIPMETEWSKENEKMLVKYKKIDAKKNLIKLAYECFSEVTDFDKNHADAWYKKGHMEVKLNKIRDAMLSFDNVINSSKNYPNKENIALFDDIKREKGIPVKYSKAFHDGKHMFKTKTGHIVRNKTEKLIADFLFDNDLMFQYSMVVSWSDNNDFRATFYIHKLDLYLEHFKYDYIKDFQKLMKWKVNQYEKNKKRLIFTVSEDEKSIEEALKLKLKPYIML